jgi:hypothetical protein
VELFVLEPTQERVVAEHEADLSDEGSSEG